MLTAGDEIPRFANGKRIPGVTKCFAIFMAKSFRQAEKVYNALRGD